MFKIFCILCFITPKIALAGSHSKSFWNTFWASILVGLFLVCSIKIFEIIVRKVVVYLKNFQNSNRCSK